MRFLNVQCPCCNEKFTAESDVVVCPLCGTPHHRSCYNENGKCINNEKHSESFSWEFPAELKPKFEFPKRKSEMPEETQYKFKNGESAVTCPHCKTINYGNDALCMKCKKPLGERSEKVPEHFRPRKKSDKPLTQAEIEYEYFRRYGGLKPYIVIDGMSAKDMSTYIGKNQSGRYIRKYANMERYDRKFSVSVPAMILGPIWFFYRKLFKEGLLVVLIMLLLTAGRLALTVDSAYMEYLSGSAEITKEIVSELIADGDINFSEAEYKEKIAERQPDFDALAKAYEEKTMTSSSSFKAAAVQVIEILQMAFPFALALIADSLYKKKMKKDIRAVTRQHTDPEQFHAALKKKGGISVAGAILGIVLRAGIYMISVLPLYTLVQAIADALSQVK